MTKVAVVVSYPVQHFWPQYSSWSTLAGVVMRVLFASQHSFPARKKKNFGRVIQWGGLALDFPHEFLLGAKNSDIGGGIDAPLAKGRLSYFAPEKERRVSQQGVWGAES